MACVLIVDDDETDRLLMKTILSDGANQLYLAANGEQALKLYLRHPIEVVVTDIQMPRGDGIELISALKGLDPDVAIVAVSGKDLHKLEIAQLAGARAILPKPLDPERLISAVAAAAGGSEAEAAP
jgi:CheY-like chemotaxis protein